MRTGFAEYYTEGGRVNSSFIEEVYYDSPSQSLYVVYRDHDSHRVYLDVPASQFQSLWNQHAQGHSVGGYYNDYIKSQFESDTFEYSDLTKRNVVGGTLNSPVVNGNSTGGNSTGPHLHFGAQFVTDPKEYTITFRVENQESEFKVTADNDVKAVEQFVKTIESLGLDYSLATVSRAL